MTALQAPVEIVPSRGLIHSLFLQFRNVSLTLVLAADVLYWQTVNLLWLEFSTWLLFVGLSSAVIAAVVAVLEHVFRSRTARRRGVAARAILTAVLICVAFVNNLVHARDGWTAVMPLGLTLSVVTVLLLAATALAGRRAARVRLRRERHA
jgi:uncharacterized membrane protein